MCNGDYNDRVSLQLFNFSIASFFINCNDDFPLERHNRSCDIRNHIFSITHWRITGYNSNLQIDSSDGRARVEPVQHNRRATGSNPVHSSLDSFILLCGNCSSCFTSCDDDFHAELFLIIKTTSCFDSNYLSKKNNEAPMPLPRAFYYQIVRAKRRLITLPGLFTCYQTSKR